MQYSYLVVEGPHDVEFIGRLLRICGLRKLRLIKDLAAYWRPTVPPSFPHGGDLLKRVPVPVFFQSDTHAVAVHSAGSISRLAPTVEETFAILGTKKAEISSIGLFLDADQNGAHNPFELLKAKIQTIGLAFPDQPGEVNHTGVRTGIFIFPDNHSPGTLENLLDDCAALIYPELREKAQQFTAGVATAPLMKKDLREFVKPAGRMKVTMGCIANFLRPAKAIQTSIADNRWLCDDSLTLPNIARLNAFLKDLLGL